MRNDTTENSFEVCNQCRIKKIRCDREKPSCGNCGRSKLCCEWSGLGKKGNQITMLNRTITMMGTRLQEVEATMLEFQQSLKRSHHASNNPSPAFSNLDGEGPPMQSQSYRLPTPSSSITPKPLFARPAGRLDEDGLVYFGATSLESLMLHFREFHANGIESATQECRDDGLTLQDRIKSFVQTKTDRHLSRLACVTEPPLVILDCMMEPYFSNVNPHFPIWSRDGFQRISTFLRRHNVHPDDEWASIVCCNNLILINLTANSMQSVRRQSMQSETTESDSSMTLDFVAGFLANSKRAIENLGMLAPRLINVQALLSLCIVAQHHLPLHILDFVFTQAFRCAEAMGIFQWQRLRDQLEESDVRDYKNIAYCLYILDKQICWTAGISQRVIKSNIQLDLTLPDEVLSRSLTAKAQLAAIEEDIFLQVYASHGKARTADEVWDVVEPISHRLDDWLVLSGVDVEASTRNPESCPVQAALLFSSLCTKLLLIWPFREHSHAFFQQHYSLATTCVRLLLSLWSQSTGGGEQHVSVPLYRSSPWRSNTVKTLTDDSCSLITSHPPLYLLDFCFKLLSNNNNDNDNDNDKTSLYNFSKMLTAIVGSRRDLSYTKRLEEMSLILMDAVNNSGAAVIVKRRRTGSSAKGPSRHTVCHRVVTQDQRQQQLEQTLPKQMATPMSTTTAAGDHGPMMYTGNGSMSQDAAYTIPPSEFSFPYLDTSAKTQVLRDSEMQRQQITPASSTTATTFGKTDSLEEDYSEDMFNYLAFIE